MGPENLGHAVVVHAADDTRASCGTIGDAREYLATAAPYPGYEGDHEITGYVVLAEAYAGASTLRVTVHLSGLEVDTEGGVHVHVGTTCADADDVGGHYYDSESLDTDPWDTVWVSDGNGDSSTSFVIDSGYELSDNLDHSIVIHDSNGDRISCGVLIDPHMNRSGSSSGFDTNALIIILICVALVIIIMVVVLVKVFFKKPAQKLADEPAKPPASGAHDVEITRM